jgi:hypothetical protein
VIRGFITYFGTYTVSGPGTLRLHVVRGSFPKWNDADQKRSFVINGDAMSTRIQPFRSATPHLMWKRVATAP